MTFRWQVEQACIRPILSEFLYLDPSKILSAYECPNRPLLCEFRICSRHRFERFQHVPSLAIIVFGAARFRVNEEVAIYAIALAISVIPEGLIAVLTITMSAGTSRMAKNSVIVRRLNALEALGGVTYVHLADRAGSVF